MQIALKKRAEEVGVLDCKAIPWKIDADQESQSSNHLTVNLALWWLHLLATGDNDIADQKTYGALRDANSDIWGSVALSQVSFHLSVISVNFF